MIGHILILTRRFYKEWGVETIVRNFITFIIGFSLSFILSPNLFDESSSIINTLYRVCFGLFFLFVIWIVQPKRKNVNKKNKNV
ncbi:hypothetical protein GCM10011384_43190 [Psychrobacillus lasiicapitis]|nr:hypothetical protein GCM10011384_43190 [Psychrobacillus lasiicapitis]